MNNLTENLFKQLSLTTLIIAYFFFCGGMYLYTFWGQFDVDPSGILTVADIPKAFIYPLVRLLGFKVILFFLVVAGLVLFLYELGFKVDQTTYNSPTSLSQDKVKSKRRFEIVSWSLIIILAAFVFLAVYRMTSDPKSITHWIVISAIYSMLVISLFYIRYTFYRPHIRHVKLTFVLMNLLTILPANCYWCAIKHAQEVRDGDTITQVGFFKDEHLIFPKSARKIQIKLIDFIGDKVAVAPTNNLGIFLIDKSYFDVVHLSYMNLKDSFALEQKIKADSIEQAQMKDTTK